MKHDISLELRQLEELSRVSVKRLRFEEASVAISRPREDPKAGESFFWPRQWPERREVTITLVFKAEISEDGRDLVPLPLAITDTMSVAMNAKRYLEPLG